MIGAALYLSQRSFVNAMRRRLERLRQPKYLIGFCIGLLYFYWLIFRPSGSGAVHPYDSAIPASWHLGEAFAVVGLVVMMLLTWVFGRAETPFTFQLAETDFLFTAPLTRPQLLRFRLVRSQLALLVSAVFSVLVFSRGHFHAGLLLRVAGVWLLYLTLQLHNAGAALVRASLSQQGVTGVKRRLVSLAVLGGLLAALWLGLRTTVPEVVAGWQESAAQGAAVLVRALHHGVLGVALWPFFAVVGPLLASGAAEFAMRLPAALAVVAVHFLWVMRSTLAFEEAAVEHANRVARRLEAMRHGRADLPARPGTGGAPRTLVRLAPTGPPAGAIVWKNVTGALREFRPRTLLLLGLLVFVFGTALSGREGPAGPGLVAVLSLAVAGVVLLFGPLALRYDLRRDLELLDVLKTWPVRSRDLIAAQVLAPALLISAVVCLGLCGAFAASLADAALPPMGERIAYLVAALAAVPPVVLVLLLVQNAAVLLFPAWTTIGPERATGFEAMGQRILIFAGTACALCIAVLPAALVGGLAGIVAHAAGGGRAWTAAAWSVTGAAMLGFECYLAVRVLAPVFDRMEPAGMR